MTPGRNQLPYVLELLLGPDRFSAWYAEAVKHLGALYDNEESTSLKRLYEREFSTLQELLQLLEDFPEPAVIAGHDEDFLYIDHPHSW